MIDTRLLKTRQGWTHGLASALTWMNPPTKSSSSHAIIFIGDLMQKKKIRIPRKKIAEFSHRWKVVEFSLFGSVLRDDFRPDSDVDVLVTFAPNAEISLFDLVQMKIDLEKIFHRPVDVIEKDALENPFRKREILRTAQVVYAA